MNSVVLIGQLAETPKFSYANKTLYCTFSLNVKRELKQKHLGIRTAQTIDCIPIVLWDRQAQFARRNFRDNYNKHLVMITGEIHIQFYHRDGSIQWTPKVVGDNIVIVG